MVESAAKIASLEETLKKEGYSKKAIKEVLKWYGLSSRQKAMREKKKRIK